MSQCISTPTATQYGTFTTDSFSTSFTETVTTLPPITTTTQTVVCAAPTTATGSVFPAVCVTSEVVTTIPGGETTTQVPIVITVPVTTTSPTQTLYSTTCSNGGGGNNNNTPSPPTPRPPNSSSTPSVTPPSSSPTPSISTLPPVTSVSVAVSSSTDAGGSVIVVSRTSTMVVTPTIEVAPTTASSSSKTPVGPIVGGVVGGIALIGAIIILAIWCLRRKHRMTDDEFNDIEEKIRPFGVKTGNRLSKSGGDIDDASAYPDKRYTEGFSAGGPTSEVGMSNSVAGVPGQAGQVNTNNVHRRNPTLGVGAAEGMGYAESNAPSQGTSGYGYGGGLGPASEGSVLSGSQNSGSNTTADSRRPLMVSNPNPGAPLSLQDVKNPQIYMSAGGVEVRGEASASGSGYGVGSSYPGGSGAAGSSSMGSSSQGASGSSSAPYQHHDGGRPQAGPLPRKGEPQAEPTEHEEAPPPAYEA